MLKHGVLARFCQLLLAVAVVSILHSCGKSSANSSRKGSEVGTPAVQASTNTLTEHKLPSVNNPARISTESANWLEAAREDPDPRVRLHAIESWAKNPGNTFDPVTHALVDPDESVRTRAQELFEEALARK